MLLLGVERAVCLSVVTGAYNKGLSVVNQGALIFLHDRTFTDDTPHACMRIKRKQACGRTACTHAIRLYACMRIQRKQACDQAVCLLAIGPQAGM